MTMAMNVTKSVVVGGKTLTERVTITDALAVVIEEAIAAAKAGNLTVKTDADTGNLTMDSTSHGIGNGSRVDLYWGNGSRYGMSVTVLTGNTGITVDGGAGDNLPGNNTPITAMNPTAVPLAITGDNLSGLGATSPASTKSTLTLVTSGNSTLLALRLGGGTLYDWNSASGITNPLAGGTVARVFISHNQTSSKTPQLAATSS